MRECTDHDLKVEIQVINDEAEDFDLEMDERDGQRDRVQCFVLSC